MTPDATLASIDGALRDWGTSGDAMRWQPDPDRVICDGGRLWPEVRSPWHGEDGYRSYLIGISAALTDRVNAIAEGLSADLPDGMRFEWVTVDATSVQAAGEQMAAAATQAYEAVMRTYGPALRSLRSLWPAWAKGIADVEHVMWMTYYPRQHRRCRTCNPAGNPRPLAIDGAAYRTRQRNRRKRR